ncbi:MAG: hypothetical protein R6U87_00115 [Thiohalospira sp.]
MPELDRAGGGRALVIHTAAETAFDDCAADFPVLEVLAQDIADCFNSVTKKSAMHLIAAVGVAMIVTDNGR